MRKGFLLGALLLALGLAGTAMAQVRVDVRILPPGWMEPEPPHEFHDAGRQGFHDGIRAARADVDARARFGAARHDEFRHPPVDRPFRDEYRNAFQRGYNEVISHLVAPPPPQAEQHWQDHPQPRAEWAPEVPQEFRDAGRQGFHAGVDAARRDFAGRQRPDAHRHPEFKHPPFNYGPDKDEYRVGFQRGYDRAMDHLLNGR